MVRHALEPAFERLGPDATSDAILDLKICDPAMGSGAFLVEACRQLGNVLVEAWRVHGDAPAIPPDEDEVIFARRLVALLPPAAALRVARTDSIGIKSQAQLAAADPIRHQRLTIALSWRRSGPPMSRDAM